MDLQKMLSNEREKQQKGEKRKEKREKSDTVKVKAVFNYDMFNGREVTRPGYSNSEKEPNAIRAGHPTPWRSL